MGVLVQSQLFPTVLGMSWRASLVIGVVLLARLCLKGAPKVFSYALWGVVLFRLLCPVSIAGDVSVFHWAEASGKAPLPEISAVQLTEGTPLSPPPSAGEHIVSSPREVSPQSVAASPAAVLPWFWLAGFLAMTGYGIVSLIQLRRTLIGAVKLRRGLYLADHIPTPFVLGILRPAIYLPSFLSEEERTYVIHHEQRHIRRLDHIWKGLAFLALSLHWFNPLVWIAFLLAEKDMEMSCDEAVLRQLGPDARGDYSASLLRLATGRRRLAAAPLSFGRGDTRERIQNALRWTRPKTWVSLTAAALCTWVVTVCVLDPPPETGSGGESQAAIALPQGPAAPSLPPEFPQPAPGASPAAGESPAPQEPADGTAVPIDAALSPAEAEEGTTDPLAAAKPEPSHETIPAPQSTDAAPQRLEAPPSAVPPRPAVTEGELHTAIMAHHEGTGDEGASLPFYTEAHQVWDQRGERDDRVVYALVWYAAYDWKNGMTVFLGGRCDPAKLTFHWEEGWQLTDFWQPADNQNHDAALWESLPPELARRASEGLSDTLCAELNAQCQQAADQYYSVLSSLAPVDAPFSDRPLSLRTDPMDYDQRLSWIKARPADSGEAPVTCNEYWESGGTLAYLGQWADTSRRGQYVLSLRFSDGATADLPLPTDSLVSAARPMGMGFQGGVFRYEVPFSRTLTVNEGETPVLWQGTYHYAVDLVKKTVYLSVL